MCSGHGRKPAVWAFNSRFPAPPAGTTRTTHVPAPQPLPHHYCRTVQKWRRLELQYIEKEPGKYRAEYAADDVSLYVSDDVFKVGGCLVWGGGGGDASIPSPMGPRPRGHGRD